MREEEKKMRKWEYVVERMFGIDWEIWKYVI
jgi:hypothetical protein